MTANEQARIAFGKLMERMPYDELRKFTEELIEKAKAESSECDISKIVSSDVGETVWSGSDDYPDSITQRYGMG